MTFLKRNSKIVWNYIILTLEINILTKLKNIRKNVVQLTCKNLLKNNNGNDHRELSPAACVKFNKSYQKV